MTTWQGKAAKASAMAVGILVFASASVVAGEMGTKTTVHRFADQSVIDGAEATLMRMDHGVATTLDTVELNAGDAVTLWWVVFNDPENCSGGKCGEDDVFNLDASGEFILNDDGSPPANRAQRKAAQISLAYADGHVIDMGGKSKFRGQLPVGDQSQVMWGPGLMDPMKAEIHLVVRSHQQAKSGQIDAMTYTLNGGCADKWPFEPCEDVQFSVFMPAAN